MNKTKNYIKYKHLTIILSVLLLGAIECHAADWSLIKKTKNAQLFVDMDSYNETDGLPFITAKEVFKSPQSKLLNGKKITYFEVHSTSLFNCQSQRYKTLETHFYHHKNKQLGSEKSDESFKPIEPNTKHATIASLACQVHKMLGGA